MKVVINRCFGGFSFSEAAAGRLVAAGLQFAPPKEHAESWANAARWGSFHFDHHRENWFRCDPRVVAVVEEMGKAAAGRHADLGVVEVPFDSAEGWEVDDYDGSERVVECHRSWS